MKRSVKESDCIKPWERQRSKRDARAKRAPRCRVLIVSEDTKSSCYYFQAYAKSALPGYVCVVVRGCGRGAMSLVKETPELEKEELDRLRRGGVINPKFDEVWVVFDKDDVPDDRFDNAIRLVESKQRHYVAWSNECFEYWYLLHFNEYKSAMERRDIFKKLEGVFPAFRDKFPKSSYKDLKGEAGRKFHEEMAVSTSLSIAIERARKQHQSLQEEKKMPHACNPATTIYKLMESLERTCRIGEQGRGKRG